MSLSYPDDRRYHPEHLWAQSRSDGSVLVGISDYAQDQLGAVIFVELPETGAHSLRPALALNAASAWRKAMRICKMARSSVMIALRRIRGDYDGEVL